MLFPSVQLANHAARHALPTEFKREQVDAPGVSSAALHRWRAVYAAGEAHWELTPLDVLGVHVVAKNVRQKMPETYLDTVQARQCAL